MHTACDLLWHYIYPCVWPPNDLLAIFNKAHKSLLIIKISYDWFRVSCKAYMYIPPYNEAVKFYYAYLQVPRVRTDMVQTHSERRWVINYPVAAL